MSNVIPAPSIAFPAELIAYFEASIALHKSQSAAAPIIDAAPVKPDVKPRKSTVKPDVAPINADAPYGFKADGVTPRKRPVPTWLNNVKSDDTPVKPRKSNKTTVKPTNDAPTNVVITVPTTNVAEDAAWMSAPARDGSTQHIRILAAELALFGAKSRKLTVLLTDKFDTKGEASAHYQTALAPRCKSKGLDIRNGSANWKLAAAIIRKAIAA